MTSPVASGDSPLEVLDCTYAPTFQYHPDPDSGSSAFFCPL